MKNSILKKEIVFLIFLLILTYGVAYSNTPTKPLIGTCYHSMAERTERTADGSFVDLTDITSFRLRMKWAGIDTILAANGGSYSAVADLVDEYMPQNVERIFQLIFWNPDKMKKPSSIPNDTYPVADAYVDSFRDMCYHIAFALKDVGVRYFVLHNEPNILWTPEGYGPNWRGTAAEFADQCEICAQAIRRANPAAYIIYGAFWTNDTTDGFINDSVDDIMNDDSTLIDALDFHYYGDTSGVASIADTINDLAQLYDLDWMILETRGPNGIIHFPIDSPCPSQDYPDSTIYGALLDLVKNHHIVENDFRDSLYAWTRHYDSLDATTNFGLPENWDSLETLKIADFNARVPVFVQQGASVVHWFSAFEVGPDDPINWCDFEDDEEMESRTPEEKVDGLIKYLQNMPLNIVRYNNNGCNPTDFSNRVLGFIDSLTGSNPRVNPNDSNDGSGFTDDLSKIKLFQNYPNAFNASTEIGYYLPNEAVIKIEIYNLLGRKVKTIYDGRQPAGNHIVIWDASGFSSGIYFCRLFSGEKSLIKKMVLLK